MTTHNENINRKKLEKQTKAVIQQIKNKIQFLNLYEYDIICKRMGINYILDRFIYQEKGTKKVGLAHPD
jgi:hypothetical protein